MNFAPKAVFLKISVMIMIITTMYFNIPRK
jgi:hypothetical protein